MRNNGFGYGKRALETFNFFYGLKLIENKLDAMNFSENEKPIFAPPGQIPMQIAFLDSAPQLQNQIYTFCIIVFSAQ